MTWVDKLLDKRKSVYDCEAEESESICKWIMIDDLVSGVLEKNREIKQEAESQFYFSTKQDRQDSRMAKALVDEILKDEQACAWRELVNKCSEKEVLE